MAKSTAAAIRYARALLDVSVRDGDPRKAEQDLAGFVALLEGHDGLRKALTNPAVPSARKRASVEALVRQAGGLAPAVERLLLLLAERDRLALVPDLLEAYRARLMDHLQIVQARVTTAVPLARERVRALERRLAEATGKQTTVVAEVDPSIIGGVVTRVGSVVYDGSVARHLQRIKERLEQGA